MASKVMNKCYEDSKELGRKLLVRKLTNWGDATVFALAESGKAQASSRIIRSGKYFLSRTS